ncbi:MAG TPA: alpha/beta fold hydrolase [Ilumatobacteraceae bacterium]|nr:alpha/beta fold hydrolase [Ilumatobacteraceae bacterium]
MSDSPGDSIVPWLPAGYTLVVPGRGELFYRFHRHPDPAAPIAFLLHGWTASGDLQFFTAYEALAAQFSIITFDYRGHGRGLRLQSHFELEDVADDAAALLEALGVEPVVAVGYSMGGPVGMLLARRHRHLVRGIVMEATALEWCSSVLDRLRWRTARIIGPLLRSVAYQRWLTHGIRRLLGPDHPMQIYVPWLSGEMRRNDPISVVQAGQALSRYDARPWVSELHVPAASLITIRDRLVKPRKQRVLAQALGAEIRELDGDHISAWEHPVEFAAVTVELVELVAAKSAAAAAPASSHGA